MAFKIAIASGKGGTGKTTVAVNLHYFIRKYVHSNTLLVDCDVEEPNDVLFYPNATLNQQKEVTQLIPEIDQEKCTYCRKCAQYCEFNAITIIPKVKYTSVDTDLCHSCGACVEACEFGAITEKPLPIGKINFYNTQVGNGLVEGELKVGSPMQTMVIKQLKKNITNNNLIVLYDAPPGTSCPMVETISDADYTILVTEPTPFGLHDLKLAVALLKEINKPFGVIINKSGIGDDGVYQYLKKEGIELLGELPFDKAYASMYAVGDLLNSIPKNIEERYKDIIYKILKKMQ